jgi:hypothetical protein
MKNAVFWDVTPCGCYKNRRSYETLVLRRLTRRDIQQDGILPKFQFNFGTLCNCNVFFLMFEYSAVIRTGINLKIKA